MKDIVIIGCGGLGREVCQYLNDINAVVPAYNVLGFIDDNPFLWNETVGGVRVLGGRDMLPMMSHNGNLYAFCAVANPQVKVNLYALMSELTIRTVNIIHPTAYLTPSVILGENVLIGPFCVLTTDIRIGNCVHINPQCGIGHDACIGDYSTLYWNVNVSGAVRIGKRCEIGSQTVIKQLITLADDVVTGAGSVVVKDVATGVTVKGVPARASV